MAREEEEYYDEERKMFIKPPGSRSQRRSGGRSFDPDDFPYGDDPRRGYRDDPRTRGKSRRSERTGRFYQRKYGSRRQRESGPVPRGRGPRRSYGPRPGSYPRQGDQWEGILTAASNSWKIYGKSIANLTIDIVGETLLRLAIGSRIKNVIKKTSGFVWRNFKKYILRVKM